MTFPFVEMCRRQENKFSPPVSFRTLLDDWTQNFIGFMINFFSSYGIWTNLVLRFLVIYGCRPSFASCIGLNCKSNMILVQSSKHALRGKRRIK